MAATGGAGGGDGGEGGGGEERPKPFTPEEARGLVLSLQRPAVFCSMADDWPALSWTAGHIATLLGDAPIRFRMGKRDFGSDPQFETSCDYVDATLADFMAWSDRGKQTDDGPTDGGQTVSGPGPFDSYDARTSWAYADYKYMASMFAGNAHALRAVTWSDFGFPGRGGKESSLWIGSAGANTLCHQDSYGCNLVLQVQGRIPYEESSVFSRVNVVRPDLRRFPRFTEARAHVVTLEPGQVLLVPRHWWHYVESIDPVTVSINSWIELDDDHRARVEEAITRLVVCAVKGADDPDSSETWLNPTEPEQTSHDTNCQYLNRAVASYFEHQESSAPPEPRARPSQGPQGPQGRGESPAGWSREGAARPWPEKKLPFGRGLVPVLPQPRGALEVGNGHSRHDGNPEGESDRGHSDHWDKLERPTQPQSPISTNELLGCLLDPRVIHLVAELLLEGRTLRPSDLPPDEGEGRHLAPLQ
ncbi:HSPB1-associated protein 1 isoform X2 [Tachyglossus aculeatus]|uniref:HSPB1-associated protein 1 isoform X2 n=1 Tax=Tachyglossus aculeatus TaxID=9261 RepID=UPI0018F4BEF9|nr:HSPB1-associated protein 1 isoform X2 [Tachyglossus aculeatus]